MSYEMRKKPKLSSQKRFTKIERKNQAPEHFDDAIEIDSQPALLSFGFLLITYCTETDIGTMADGVVPDAVPAADEYNLLLELRRQARCPEPNRYVISCWVQQDIERYENYRWISKNVNKHNVLR
jgi:hypothetical protein